MGFALGAGRTLKKFELAADSRKLAIMMSTSWVSISFARPIRSANCCMCNTKKCALFRSGVSTNDRAAFYRHRLESAIRWIHESGRPSVRRIWTSKLAIFVNEFKSTESHLHSRHIDDWNWLLISRKKNRRKCLVANINLHWSPTKLLHHINGCGWFSRNRLSITYYQEGRYILITWSRPCTCQLYWAARKLNT